MELHGSREQKREADHQAKSTKNPNKQADMNHNRKKQYILEEGTMVPFFERSWSYDRRREDCADEI